MSPIINSTFITLIPKKNSVDSVSNFCPISLCNVFYKLVSKAFTNRLKPLINAIISCNQSSFIIGRLITDNIMVAHKLLHTVHKQKRGRVGRMVVKLDMSKAYDRVEWPYLQATMKALGFNGAWIKLIMSYVSTVSYSVLVNGKPGETFTPSRGLRQGDPLSPYLFLICAEGLSALLRRAENNGTIHGLAAITGETRISHLFFADDSILFCKAMKEEWENVWRLLDVYDKGSGQQINNKKS